MKNLPGCSISKNIFYLCGDIGSLLGESVMKRESGESPEQTRCCKFRMIFRKSAGHCRKDGKAPEKKQVRRPASVVHSFLCFREIRYENNELDFSLPVLDIRNPLLFVFACVSRA